MGMRLRKLLILLAITPLFAHAQPLNKPKLGLHTWAWYLTQPVGVENCGDDRLFVVEKQGLIRIVTDSMEVATRPFLDIREQVDDAGNEQGCLGLAFEPNYLISGYFYVYYIFGTGSGVSRISRFQVTDDPDSASAASEQVIYEWPQPYWNHNGGDLHFGPDGYLYMAFGDGGGANDQDNNGQDYTDPLGGFIRIDVSAHDSTFLIPPDNPFANADGTDTLPEIWSTGLRNPFRWSFDRLTGDLWIGDVGQVTWEEIDFRPAGDNSCANFGWRCREGFTTNTAVDQTMCSDSATYVSPVAVFDHIPAAQGGQAWCSVMGGYVYRGATFPHHYGHYIFTDYCAGDFLTFAEDGSFDVDTMLMTTTSGYAGIGEDVHGHLYVVNQLNGELKKIFDPCPMADPEIWVNGQELTAPEGLTYQWYMNGEAIADATDHVYIPEVAGQYQVVVDLGAPCTLISDTLAFVPVGFAEHSCERLRLFPLPASDLVTVEWHPAQLPVLVALFDALGRSVLLRSWPAHQASVTLDVKRLSPGAYGVHCVNENGLSLDRSTLIISR